MIQPEVVKNERLATIAAIEELHKSMQEKEAALLDLQTKVCELESSLYDEKHRAGVSAKRFVLATIGRGPDHLWPSRVVTELGTMKQETKDLLSSMNYFNL